MMCQPFFRLSIIHACCKIIFTSRFQVYKLSQFIYQVVVLSTVGTRVFPYRVSSMFATQKAFEFLRVQSWKFYPVLEPYGLSLLGFQFWQPANFLPLKFSCTHASDKRRFSSFSRYVFCYSSFIRQPFFISYPPVFTRLLPAFLFLTVSRSDAEYLPCGLKHTYFDIWILRIFPVRQNRY